LTAATFAESLCNLHKDKLNPIICTYHGMKYDRLYKVCVRLVLVFLKL